LPNGSSRDKASATISGVASARFGLSDALALAATSYVLCLVALLFLPETRGKSLGG
jgi:hypothetical protein